MSALARLIDVERSSLGRFLHAVPGYEPTRDRQGKVEMLEKLDALCSGHHLRLEMERELVTPRNPGAEPETEFDVMLRHFNERVVLLGERYESALSMVVEFFGYAVGPPKECRASMCGNLLRVVASLLEHPGIADVSDSLLRETAERVRRLEAGVLDVELAERGGMAPHPSSSAGFSLALLGIRLDNDTLIEDGLERMERAAFDLSEPDDEAPWASLLAMLERLLEREHPRAGERSERVARRAAEAVPAGLVAAFKAGSLPHVRAHWSDLTPGLMRSIMAE